MAFEIRKTNHAGAKNGGGAWCERAVAKTESSRVRRRVDDREAISDGLEDYLHGRPHSSPVAGPPQRLRPQLPFQRR